VSAKALKAVGLIKRFKNLYSDSDTKVLFFLFDRMVTPILLYGSEIWGTEIREAIEIIHRKLCKYVMGVGSQTSNTAVLGDCGRYPLFIDYFTNGHGK
jgi:hypothetical protein